MQAGGIRRLRFHADLDRDLPLLGELDRIPD
jgi:hypothetical protein